MISVLRTGFAALHFLLPFAAGAAPITTGTLVDEMVDMFRLSEARQPDYRTLQFSSYDHRSSVPGGPDWFANSDGFGQEPIPNFESVLKAPGADGIGEYLVCDIQEAGAIVRVWTAAIEGTLRVYLDGATDPVYDGPAQEFLMHPWTGYARGAGLDAGVLDGTFYQRNAAYCPMPFAKGCRIVWIGDVNKIHFYQIQARVYEGPAEVVTFRPEDLKTHAETIRRVAGILKSPGATWPYHSKETPRALNVTVEPGARADALSLEGPGAIERLMLRVSAKDSVLALRQTVLHVVCDGSTWGQVQAPTGDFFGAAPGVNPYDSVPFTVEADGAMTCRFVMPYAKNAKVFFENLGEQAVTIEGEALVASYTWNDDTSMHFRARWRIDHGITASGAEPQDIPFLAARGAGAYVGSVSYVLNPNDVPSPGGNWWGEGDEKIFVDEDIRPSTFGTGSEDYYNYAWSSPDIFVFPYCGQPRNDGPANRGFVTNHRWHVLDDLPFGDSLAFYMELFPHELNHGMAYGRIGYYYARPGAIDDHVTITPEDVRGQVLPPWEPAARGAASNSVFYQAEEVDEPRDDVILEKAALWARGGIYRWTPKQEGDSAVFTIPIAEDGRYIVRPALGLDAKSGKITMLVDDAEAGSWDLHDASRVMERCMDTAPRDLKKGEHRIAIRFDGGEKNVPIDFFWIQKQ